MSNPFMRLDVHEPPATATESNPFMKLSAHGAPDPGTIEKIGKIAQLLAEKLVVEPVTKVSKGIVWSLTGTLPGEPQQSPAQIGDVATTLASTKPARPLSPENQRDVAEGTAFAASFVGAPLLGAVAPGAEAVLGRWGSFAAGEFLGGSIYGAARPLDEDESRLNAVLGDAATFAGAGLLFKSVGEGAATAYKRYIMRMPTTKRKIALGMAKAALNHYDDALSSSGVNLDQIPPETKSKLEEPILRAAIQHADPAAVDLDRVVREEADKELETTPRMAGEKVDLKLPAKPLEDEFDAAVKKEPLRELSDAELEKLPFGKTPPKAESALAREYKGPERRAAEHPVDIERRRGAQKEYDDLAAVLDRDRTPEIVATAKRYVSVQELRRRAEAQVGTTKGFYGSETLDRAHSVVYAAYDILNEQLDRLEPQLSKAGREKIVGVAVKGASGKIYKGAKDEITHPQLMARLAEEGVDLNEFVDAKTGGYSKGDVPGYITSTGRYISKDQAMMEQMKGALPLQEFESPGREHLVGPAVKGKSGKVYVGGSTHPETMESAIKAGAPKEEFEGIGALHASRGFRTNLREFISRDEAQALAGHPTPLFSEHLHARKLLPFESVEAAEKSAADMAKSMDVEKTPLSLAETAVMDAATDHAVAQIKPLDVSDGTVKQAAKEIQEAIEIHGLPEKPVNQHLANVLSKALDKEGPAAEKGVVLTLTQPGPIELQMGSKLGAGELREVRESLARTLRREQPPISVSVHERVGAPWEEGAQELTVPKKMDGLEVAGHARDLDGFLDELQRVAKDKTGFVKPEYMARLAVAGIGGLAEALGTFDDHLSEGEKTGLRAVGALLLLSAAFPAFRRLTEKSETIRDLVKMYNPAKAMSGDAQAWREYVETFTKSGLKRHDAEKAIKEVFPDEASQRAAMFVLDEGPAAPEFASLTDQQKRMAAVLHQYNLRLGMILKSNGVLDEYLDNYVRHLLPPGTFNEWKRQGGIRVLPTGGAFTRPRKMTLRELEDWAKSKGLEGPSMNLPGVHSYHMAEADRALATTRLAGELKKQSLIADMPKPGQSLPDGWRGIEGIAGMKGKMAPEDVARDLNTISTLSTGKDEVMRALDSIKGRWVKAIMFWWWEHGLNAMRSYLALSFNPARWREGSRLLSEPAIREEMASVGVNLYGRPADYSIRVNDTWKSMLQHVNLGSLGARMDKLQEMNDKKLWDEIIPALQTFAYVSRMRQWVESNSRKGIGGPEYLAEARRAADFANTVAGRVPQELANPVLARRMRLLMFSPQWTGTRMAMWAHTAGEVSDMIDGKLNPRDALYVPFKLRQLAWGIGITYLGSKLIFGKDPEFNPNNTRFYMHTNFKDRNGRDMGVDLTGWWQDELRFVSRPMDFAMNRLNPVIKLGAETIEGRDYLGRSMTGGQTIANIISAFGPPVQAAADALRLARGSKITSGEAVRMASRTLATGNVAALPRPMEVALAKLAKKILIQQGVPASTDNIYELAQRMRGNLIAGKDLIDEPTVKLLAARKRSAIWEVPLPGNAAMNGIWQEARGVLADFQQ